MNTSRAALDRLLNPGNTWVTLQTLTREAHAAGREGLLPGKRRRCVHVNPS